MGVGGEGFAGKGHVRGAEADPFWRLEQSRPEREVGGGSTLVRSGGAGGE